ncbi:hypothetical protein MAR_032126 [Mya arenaria]|uniref:Uncharacterized protein n=1 Tax=Mya arenaria TaxID=6604 RepID=A0ABY7F934_MYAAR|nr:hypothetical protein MAR_032126 [Mya arenaria]
MKKKPLLSWQLYNVDLEVDFFILITTTRGNLNLSPANLQANPPVKHRANPHHDRVPVVQGMDMERHAKTFPTTVAKIKVLNMQ